jgi:hypothetical protein
MNVNLLRKSKALIPILCQYKIGFGYLSIHKNGDFMNSFKTTCKERRFQFFFLLSGAIPAVRYIPDNTNYGWKPCFSKSGDTASIRARVHPRKNLKRAGLLT